MLGSVASIADILTALAQEKAIDRAVLDVNLRGAKACPVADALRERGIPFVLATSYRQWALPEACKDLPRCD